MRRLFAFLRRCFRRKTTTVEFTYPKLQEVRTPLADRLPRQVITHKVYEWKPMVTSFTRKKEEDEPDAAD